MRALLRGFAASLALVLATSPCLATSYQGTVSNVFAISGKVHVRVSDGQFDGAQGACPNGSAMWYSVDPNTAYGRSLIAIAMSAKLSARLVYVGGNGVCDSSTGIPSETMTLIDFKG